MAIFPSFFLGNIVQEIVFYEILERKNAFWAMKTTSLKSRKMEIFPKGLTHGVQKWPFFQLFFLGNIVQEIVFYDILEQKNVFLGYKYNKFKKLKT